LLLPDYRLFTIITMIIVAITFILVFSSFLTSKTPAIAVLTSLIGMFLSSYLQVSAYNVVQSATLTDGTISYNKLTTLAFDPVFFEGLHSIFWWFFVISFIVSVVFTLVVVYDAKNKKRLPKWKQQWQDRNGWES